MDNRILCLSCSIALMLAACDSDKKSNSEPKTSTRTMIIGGMPTADHDYQLVAREQGLPTKNNP